jgi:cell wall assembly regulator SMI1
MVVYFRNPHWMSKRFDWWENVDALLDKLKEVRKGVTEEVIKKLKDDIENNVPRVTSDEVERLKVVLNDLPLQKP